MDKALPASALLPFSARVLWGGSFVLAQRHPDTLGRGLGRVFLTRELWKGRAPNLCKVQVPNAGLTARAELTRDEL